jgi:hypothetical protein
MKYKEHRPNYFSGFKDKELEFLTIADLLKADVVASRFASEDNFERFSFSPQMDYRNEGFLGYLMAEQKGGKFLVSGYLYGERSELEKLNLPTWESKDK